MSCSSCGMEILPVCGQSKDFAGCIYLTAGLHSMVWKVLGVGVQGMEGPWRPTLVMAFLGLARRCVHQAGAVGSPGCW